MQGHEGFKHDLQMQVARSWQKGLKTNFEAMIKLHLDFDSSFFYFDGFFVQLIFKLFFRFSIIVHTFHLQIGQTVWGHAFISIKPVLSAYLSIKFRLDH